MMTNGVASFVPGIIIVLRGQIRWQTAANWNEPSQVKLRFGAICLLHLDSFYSLIDELPGDFGLWLLVLWDFLWKTDVL